MFWGLVLLSLPIIGAYCSGFIGNTMVLSMAFAPLLVLCFANFAVFTALFFASMFYYVEILGFTPPEMLGACMLFSFLITHRVENEKLSHDIFKAYCIFLLAILPSYTNPSIPNQVWLWSLRYVAYLTILVVFPLAFKTPSHIKAAIYIFVAGAFLNSITVISSAAISGSREFGFTGIVFVDLVGIAVTLCLVHFLFKKENRALFLSLFLFLSLALIYTQTRNSWISTMLTGVCVMLLYIVFAPKIGRQRKAAIYYAGISLLTVVLLVFALNSIAPQAFNRLEEKKLVEPSSINSLAFQANSFTSRLFIWQTALNGFLAHPYFGIGNFCFQYNSETYNTLPSLLYVLFVRGLRPHLVIVELLCETGIVGTLGYFIFLFLSWKKAIHVLKNSGDGDELYCTVSIVSVFFYSTVSLLMTDAWIWGQLQMLQASFLAGVIILYNYQNRKKTSAAGLGESQ